VAWILTVWLLLVSAFSHVLKGLDVEEAAIALLLLGVLWWFRKDFTVRSDPDAIQTILFATPYVLVFFFAYGILRFFLLQRQFRPGFNLGSCVAEVVNLATFQGNLIFRPVSRQARWFVESLPLMSGIGVLFLVYSLTRPVLRPAPPPRRDRKVARSITQDFGCSGIAYFALSPEKNYFFNEDGTCVIPCVLVGGVALAAGDVIGPEEDLASTLEQFHRFCEENN
jgi:phosphatidylglycerol lysyltransferase